MNQASDGKRAESGLTWGFELESVVLGILGDVDEVEETKLLDLLMYTKELQPLLVQLVEHGQQVPEIRKTNGMTSEYPLTAKEEIARLLNDITNGSWHNTSDGEHGAHRRLCRWHVHHGASGARYRMTSEYPLTAKEETH